MVDNAPVSDKTFAHLMVGLGLRPENGPVAVAVSGGADSMALVRLAARWGAVVALSVDHGLRPEASLELDRVGAWLKPLGILHDRLHWDGPKPASDLQAAARAARYRLLEERCRERGIHALLLAHHQNDQAETLLLRLARGSGVWGLGGMAAVAPALTHISLQNGRPLRRYRPLLSLPKARLIATCKAFSQEWIEDPSNRNLSYDRSHARALLDNPPLSGLTARRLAQTAQHMRRAGEALDHYAQDLMARCVVFSAQGYVTVQRTGFQTAPLEIQLRLLSRLLMFVGGAIYPPRLTGLEALLAEMGAAGFKGATLRGCRVFLQDGEQVIICREEAACAAPLPIKPGETVFWDGRIRASLDAKQKPAMVGALGDAGWRYLCKEGQDIDKALPYPVRLSLPALWRDGRVVAVPFLGWRGYGAGFSTELMARQSVFEAMPDVEQE
ncbi:tRNA(Ile)-lysidine synthase [Iodidimonas muriae]|uniref:tRNA(Ile)-lysidine synthase n=1 Tax=Iodidimonas muriae TaxID=261467 RepID=A0ABQ2LCE5_9PROT|nr:tRNA lysidine(34) synthetase TilS [Iodidimonas muriae]GER06738.1 tRNA(Ile)-lysidine synthase [Kordiimonadales bacterium JCM 17843]GGO10185.1 tRNA(Ile)-lysidine synthase [Iodidimonas muriae]